MANPTLEIWICVAADGTFETGTDPDEATERFEATHNPLGEETGFRLFKLMLTVPKPKPIEIAATVPDNITEPTTLVVT